MLACVQFRFFDCFVDFSRRSSFEPKYFSVDGGFTQSIRSALFETSYTTIAFYELLGFLLRLVVSLADRWSSNHPGAITGRLAWYLWFAYPRN